MRNFFNLPQAGFGAKGKRTTLRNPGRGRTPGAGAVVKQNEASHAPAPRETSTPGGEGAVVLSSLRSNARAKNVRSQPSLELVTKKSRGVSVAISSGRSAATGVQTTYVSGRRSTLH